ncbi:alpha/beta hydrolase [Slackia heliotrinireducens]|uniref:alpha/beta hydrolase n=1 Tax=Slackia heliotrinireducens TaxID=84110 RepID=UPI0033151F27
MTQTYDPSKPVEFPRGMYRLNDEPHIDYQLNRIVNWDGGDLEELRAVGGKITNFEDWKSTLDALGRRAYEEGRTKNALGYFLMRDFYTSYDDPDKLDNYHQSQRVFYEYFRELFEPSDGGAPIVERLEVPYEGGVTLPVFHTVPVGESRGVVLMHGGNDSYMEEFVLPLLYLRDHGYEVYLYEGPGQGSVIRDQKCPFTWQWEKTSKAITERFDLHDVTIIGISLGGYFAPRAAAFDKRIRRVVCWSIYPGTWDLVEGAAGKVAIKVLGALLHAHIADVINKPLARKAAKGDLAAQVMTDMCHPYGADSVCDMYRKMEDYTLANCAELVDQDVLILGADEDVYIPAKLADKMVGMLSNARSVKLRVFTTVEDRAGNHCNVGDPKAALDEILNWMDALDARDARNAG